MELEVNGNRLNVAKRFVHAIAATTFGGEVLSDNGARAAYSTDNSVYQIVPDLVVAPRDNGDVSILLEVLSRPDFAGLSVTGRGGGTGTNGQSLNRGIIVDFRRHMHRILDMDLKAGWVDVEPGIVLDDLNAQLANTGYFFAPTTSTSDRCTVGGMASTDASGKGSRIYGKTSDNVYGLEVALPGGHLLNSVDPIPHWAFDMLASVAAACDAGRAPLLARVPHLSRRFTGLDLERARPDSSTLDWWRLLIGAEGTLGLITRLRLKLTKKFTANRLGVIAFSGFFEALDATECLMTLEPLAIEVMDEWVQRLAQDAGLLDALPPKLRSDDGDPPVYAFVEFAGDDPEALDRAMTESLTLAQTLPGYRAAHAASDAAQIAQLWSVRAASVGLLGASKGKRRPVSFVEDCVVPPHRLGAFVKDVAAILASHGITYGIYGHADVGCLHLRPALDIDDPEDRVRYKAISDAVFDAATRHGGIFWGEHGKGIRGDYLEAFVGPEAFDAFGRIKAAFDPDGTFNPGKLMAPRAERYTVAGTTFRKTHSQNATYEKAFACNGNALCLTYAVTTPMCPSFKVSADLRHSPKGRAEALRFLQQARAEGTVSSALEDDVFQTLDGCLGCKSCAGSCPTHVDIPEMRSFFLQEFYRDRRRPLVDHFVLALERFAGFAARLRPVLATVAATPLYNWAGRVLGLVDLPRPSSAAALKGIPIVKLADLGGLVQDRTVVLVQDPFTGLFDTQAIADIAEGLRKLKYRPVLLALQGHGKAAHVKGDRLGFMRQAESLCLTLNAAQVAQFPLIGIDPSLVYLLRSEYPKAGIKHVPKVQAIEEFLLAEVEAGRLAPIEASSSATATLFLHCTEKTLRPNAGREWVRLFEALGQTVRLAQTGCCGMSGLFGHEKRHLAWSQKLFEMSWRPALETANDAYATGFSCRCQAKRFGGRALRHPLTLLSRTMPSKQLDHYRT